MPSLTAPPAIPASMTGKRDWGSSDTEWSLCSPLEAEPREGRTCFSAPDAPQPRLSNTSRAAASAHQAALDRHSPQGQNKMGISTHWGALRTWLWGPGRCHSTEGALRPLQGVITKQTLQTDCSHWSLKERKLNNLWKHTTPKMAASTRGLAKKLSWIFL